MSVSHEQKAFLMLSYAVSRRESLLKTPELRYHESEASGFAVQQRTHCCDILLTRAILHRSGLMNTKEDWKCSMRTR